MGVGVVDDAARVLQKVAHGDAVACRNHAGQPELDVVLELDAPFADQLQNRARNKGLGDAPGAECSRDRHLLCGTEFGHTGRAMPHPLGVQYLG
jgi:hypothetical protein